MTDPTNSNNPPGSSSAAEASSPGSVSLAPSFVVPLGVSLLGALCLPLQPSWGGFRWLALVLVLFGGFLLLQARLLRLEFNDDALLVWRGETNPPLSLCHLAELAGVLAGTAGAVLFP